MEDTLKAEQSNTSASSDPLKVRAYVFGGFRLDLLSYQLLREGEPITMNPKAFDTLALLVAQHHRAVLKEEILSTVWPDSFISEDSLTQTIYLIRRALGDHSGRPRFITTVARRGYRFIANVDEVRDTPATTAPPAISDAIATGPAHPGDHERALAESPRSAPPQPVLRWPLAVSSLVVAVLALAGIRSLYVLATKAPEPLHSFRFTLASPTGTMFASNGVLSPDGRHIVYVAVDEQSTRSRLWIRSLDATEPQVLPTTEGASAPFWSPDSQFIGFFSGGKLKRLRVGSESAQSIATISNYAAGITSATWSRNNVILFNQGRSGLYSVPMTGGAVTTVTALDSSVQEVGHWWPQFLPDGRTFLYFAQSFNTKRTGTYVRSIGASSGTRLLDVAAVYASPGYLLYVRDNALMAQPFDVSASRLTGSPTMLTGNLPASPPGELNVSSSADGTLAFKTSSTTSRIVSYSRTGQRLGSVNAPTILRNPVLAAGDKHLIASNDGHTGLWMIDLERGALTQIADGGMRPVLSPDGNSVAFASDRLTGVADIYQMKIAAGGKDELLLRSKENKIVSDWSLDGRYIVYSSLNEQTKWDLWLLPRFGDQKARRLLQTPFNETAARLSPDGHWVAYVSDESGDWEVYVDSFPEPGLKRAVSVGGGVDPHWRSDGRELFYIGADRSTMVAGMTFGPSLQIGTAAPLFRAPIPLRPTPYRNWYTVTADGQRFFIDSTESTGNEGSITVLTNWVGLLRH